MDGPPKQDNLFLNLTFLNLTLEFAVEVMQYVEILEREKRYVLAMQLLKSGTSIGANVREAQNAESKANFIHKFKIAAKEVQELNTGCSFINWLRLIQSLLLFNIN